MTNIFPGIPLIESPLFEILEPSLGLTPEEARIAHDLRRNGFAVFDFPDVDLNARIDRIQHNLGPRYGIDLKTRKAIKQVLRGAFKTLGNLIKMSVRSPRTSRWLTF